MNYPIPESRPHRYEVWLTDKESKRLAELSIKHKMSSWRILLQGLRMYDAVEGGTAELIHQDLGGGCMGDD